MLLFSSPEEAGVMFLSFTLLIRELAAEEEEEEDEGIACEQTPEDVAEAAKDENKEDKDDDDELAEYGLDKYDEEDSGKGQSLCTVCIFSLYVSESLDPESTVCLQHSDR